MKSKSFFGIILLVLVSFIFLNCSSHGISNVTIHINLGLNNASAANTFENSIFDRIFRLFTKDAEAQSAPSNVTSIILNISGSGMETISNTYPRTQTSIDIEVPSGPSRLFEVLAHTPSATLRGAVTQSLVGGSTVTIPITMGLYETKIVIPDQYGQRLVQIDNIAGNGWLAKNNLQIGYSNTFQPRDVDFDRIGRIYIANAYSATGSVMIMRLDDITDTTYSSVINESVLSVSINSLAVDRNNNLIYYATTNALYRCNLSGSSPQPITLTGITTSSIRGLAVDENGNLYIAATTGAGAPVQEVIKCTPGNPSTNVVRYPTGLIYAWDVVVKDSYLYIADYDNLFPYDSSKIVRLSLDLTYIDQLGTAGSSTFRGPHRFLAILNSRFYLIDEDENTSDVERIVAFDNFSSTIDAFNPAMVSQSAFQFYNAC